MPATIQLHRRPVDLLSSDTLLIVGRAGRLLSTDVAPIIPAGVGPRVWQSMIKRNDPGDQGRTVITHTDRKPGKVVAGILPEASSRHNAPSRAWAIPGLVQGAGLKGSVGIAIALDDRSHAVPAALAIARAHPTWSQTSSRIERQVKVSFVHPGPGEVSLEALDVVIAAGRLAGDLVDRPPDVLTTSALVAEAEAVARRNPGVSIQITRGEELENQGFGGLWGVGRAATEPPALVALDYAPDDAPEAEAVTWVGKGIVYDTGGLSIKSKTGMPGMKTDMAGSAAVLAAFEAAVRLGVRKRLTAVLCIAENAVGPTAFRPDDVLTMYSGKTVEVNNTDAEGRLVLADGAAWAVKNRAPATLIDMATLTGAQSMATGKLHGALYCNDEDLEQAAVEAGRSSGDLVHPLPYAPELFRKEFRSQVADMRNSVKDRHNAQSSCAGQFVGEHIAAAGYKGRWLHIDMAAPAVSGGRGTGWGVGLLLTLVGVAPGIGD